jgi:hypothetical protein
MVVSFYDFATKKSSIVFRMRNADSGNNGGFPSPRRKDILYAWIRAKPIYVVENFR